MPVLEYVARSAATGGVWIGVVEIVVVVCTVHHVPVELAERLVIAPHVGVVGKCRGVRFPVRRKVLVVVGAWIGAVVPLQGRCRVVYPPGGGAGIERGSCFRFPYPVEDYCRIESLDDLRTALLSVLIAPVRIVEVVSGEFVGFEISGRRCGSLRGCAECGQRQGVLVVEYFLEREEITGRVIERTGDYAFVGIAPDSRYRQSPSVFVEAGGVLGHGTEHVVAVGVGY